MDSWDGLSEMIGEVRQRKYDIIMDLDYHFSELTFWWMYLKGGTAISLKKVWIHLRMQRSENIKQWTS